MSGTVSGGSGSGSGSGDGAGGSLAGIKVLVPRSHGQAHELSDRLRALGATPVEAPTISIEPPEDSRALHDALGRVGQGAYDWVAFTSPNAVESVLAIIGPGALGATRLAAVGRGTLRELNARSVEADLVPERSTAHGLAAALIGEVGGGRVLLPRSDIASSGLPRALQDAGWEVDEVEAYRTVPVRSLPVAVATDLRAGRIHAVTFTSGSTVRGLVDLMDGVIPGQVRIASIGPATSEVCRSLGLDVDVEAEPHNLDGLIAAVLALFKSSG